MESTSEVVWEEKRKSSVTKKSVQQVSAKSIQKLSSTTSSSFIGEQNVVSIGNVDNEGSFITSQILPLAMSMEVMPTTKSSLLLSAPIITSPSVDGSGRGVNTTSIQSELSAMKLTDEQGNEIGEIVKEKQQQQSVQASSSVMVIDGGNKSMSADSKVSSSSKISSASMLKQSATTSIAEAQESSPLVSCSSFKSTQKQEIISSCTSLLSSTKSSQSIEKSLKSSTAVVEDQEF